MTPDDGGEGTTPKHEPPAAAAKSRSNAGEVSKMQRQIAELKARLAEKESNVIDESETTYNVVFRLFPTSCSKILIFLAVVV